MSRLVKELAVRERAPWWGCLLSRRAMAGPAAASSTQSPPLLSLWEDLRQVRVFKFIMVGWVRGIGG
ncbi:hypothetical protein GCM10027589_28290 [Actinocorallia lasiicapitis]